MLPAPLLRGALLRTAKAGRLATAVRFGNRLAPLAGRHLTGQKGLGRPLQSDLRPAGVFAFSMNDERPPMNDFTHSRRSPHALIYTGTPVPRLLAAPSSNLATRRRWSALCYRPSRTAACRRLLSRAVLIISTPCSTAGSWIRRRIIWTSFSSAATSRAPQLPGRRCCAMVLRLM